MDKLLSLYVDMPAWDEPVKVDDFLVCIGAKQSNSVYHVAQARTKDRGNRTQRCYLKVYRSELMKALQRDDSQRLITLTWNKR